jgi:hypothetical protein
MVRPRPQNDRKCNRVSRCCQLQSYSVTRCDCFKVPAASVAQPGSSAIGRVRRHSQQDAFLLDSWPKPCTGSDETAQQSSFVLPCMFRRLVYPCPHLKRRKGCYETNVGFLAPNYSLHVLRTTLRLRADGQSHRSTWRGGSWIPRTQVASSKHPDHLHVARRADTAPSQIPSSTGIRSS